MQILPRPRPLSARLQQSSHKQLLPGKLLVSLSFAYSVLPSGPLWIDLANNEHTFVSPIVFALWATRHIYSVRIFNFSALHFVTNLQCLHALSMFLHFTFAITVVLFLHKPSICTWKIINFHFLLLFCSRLCWARAVEVVVALPVTPIQILLVLQYRWVITRGNLMVSSQRGA